jgi:hypothetical protein
LRTTQPNPMTQTEGTITACPINLIGANNGRTMSMKPAAGQHLGFRSSPSLQALKLSRPRKVYSFPVTEMDIMAPYSRLQRELPRTTGRMWACTRLTIRSGMLLLPE